MMSSNPNQRAGEVEPALDCFRTVANGVFAPFKGLIHGFRFSESFPKSHTERHQGS